MLSAMKCFKAVLLKTQPVNGTFDPNCNVLLFEEENTQNPDQNQTPNPNGNEVPNKLDLMFFCCWEAVGASVTICIQLNWNKHI